MWGEGGGNATGRELETLLINGFNFRNGKLKVMNVECSLFMDILLNVVHCTGTIERLGTMFSFGFENPSNL